MIKKLAKMVFGIDAGFVGENHYVIQHVVPEPTVFENHRKSLIQHCKERELHFHFEKAKVH